MPQFSNAPKELNNLLEKVYSGCMEQRENTQKNKTYCSRVAINQAERLGWYKDEKDGKWKKKS